MHKKITASAVEYPPLLKQMQNCPRFLYIEDGFDEIISRPVIAILGGKMITDYGEDIVRYFVGNLCEKGFAIVFVNFGFFGQFLFEFLQKIDGFGVCVLDSGFGGARMVQSSNIFYISPFGFLVGTTEKHSLAACKVAVGISRAVLIFEVGVKKVVYDAVETSLNLGREVFAIPGSVFNPRMNACHDLIKAGAHLVSEISDITDILIN